MAWSLCSPGHHQRTRLLRGTCSVPATTALCKGLRLRCRLVKACADQQPTPRAREQQHEEPPLSGTSPGEETASASDEHLDSTEHAQSFMKSANIDDIDARLIAEDPAFAELETAARAWIGDSLARWLWWEQQKARRYQLLQQIKQQEQLVTVELAELYESLRDLQSLTGLRFVTEQGQISSLGWALIALILLLPFSLLFVLIRSIQETLVST
ncbi:hypothetical protein CCYA_CCYA17G4404 [Cyanidiococcus yangmingshanensis]|nr:hypothetical protein CCYA_CCYA17G4404 [Cyanidiococcus yangmingshanensis]